MAHVYERGEGQWWIEFQFEGRRYREAAPPNVLKKDAEQYLAKRQREVATASIYDTPVVRTSFSDFADDFLKTDKPDKKSQDRSRDVIDMLKVEWKKDLAAVTAK